MQATNQEEPFHLFYYRNFPDTSNEHICGMLIIKLSSIRMLATIMKQGNTLDLLI